MSEIIECNAIQHLPMVGIRSIFSYFFLCVAGMCGLF